jgi:hypothetical protein
LKGNRIAGRCTNDKGGGNWRGGGEGDDVRDGVNWIRRIRKEEGKEKRDRKEKGEEGVEVTERKGE